MDYVLNTNIFLIVAFYEMLYNNNNNKKLFGNNFYEVCRFKII